MHRLPLLLPLLLGALLCAGCRDPHPAFVTDEQGRALVLHGTNFSSASKSDPARVPSWAGRDDVLRLSRDWGFNFVRYLILWDALEPAPGTISQDYLDGIEQYLDWLAEAGVRVVLDMHQDVYSRVFCCDGAPEWAVRDDGLPFNPQPFWFLNYFQPAVVRSFDNFWDAAGPHADLQTRFAAAWAAVAGRFAGHPALLGYDILNEPFPGSAFDLAQSPTGPMPAFERDRYAPFLARVIAAIRAVDPDGWIFFEPTYGLPAAGSPSFLPRLEDPRSGPRRLAYFPHLYSPRLEAGGGYDPATDPTVADWESARLAEAPRHETPLLLGEFGVTDGPDGGLEFLSEVLDMADRLTSGWTIWDYEPSTGGYSFIDSDREEKAGKIDLLVRVYPGAVAGEPLRYRWFREERVFSLTWRGVPGVTGPTEIHVPPRLYPEGFDVRSGDPDGSWSHTWDAARQVLSVTADPARDVHGLAIVPAGYAP